MHPRSHSRAFARSLLALFFLTALLAVGRPAHATTPTIIYVVPGGAGSKDGSSWGNAKDLAAALTDATSGAQIWVKGGTYKPTTDTDRSKSFTLKSGVAVYGGFAGTETSSQFGQRNWGANATTLSGDIGTPNDNSDNSYHVVVGSGTDNTAILDGFTITGGNATGPYPGERGGGMYNAAGNPTLTNIAFIGNAASYGGGVYNKTSGQPNFTGGNLTLTNVVFSGNLARGTTGGALLTDGGAPTLTNVTFSGNVVPGNWIGAGIYVGSGSVTIRNSILWGDSTSSDVELACDSYPCATITNSIVQGSGGSGSSWWRPIPSDPSVLRGTDGGGNLDADPKFITPINLSQTPAPTTAGNLRLGPNSAAFNAGSNTLVPSGLTADLDDNPRIVFSIVDMGAYERQDNTPPDTTITGQPPALTSSSSATFTFAGSDNVTPAASLTFQCSLDNSAFTACASNSGQSYSGLSDGSHTFQVRAVDAAGNVDPTPASFTWTVDTTPPAAPVVITPANGSLTNNPRPTVSGTAEANSTVTVYVDGSSRGTAPADGSGNWSFTPTSSLSEGSHTVKARATDAAGNTSVDSNTNTFTVDTTLPAAPVVITPANGSLTNNPRPTVSGTAEANSTVTVYIDASSRGTAPTNGSGNWSFTLSSSLSEGSHTAKARATDAASNTSVDSNTNTFTVDTTPPAAPVVITPANGSLTNNPRPTVSGTAEANSTVTVYIDASSRGTAPTNGSGNWSFTLTSSLSEGSHTAKARATDAAGNTSVDSNTNTFTVDTVPPGVTINQAAGQADPTSASPIHFTAVFNEPVTGFANSDVTLSGAASATSAVVTQIAPNNGTTYDIAVSGMTASGAVIATIAANSATDAAGNGNTASTSTDNTVTFIYDTTPPVITPHVTGTAGNNGWYVSDVGVSWSVVDDESTVTNQTGCGSSSVTSDTSGITFTCSAASAGGTNQQRVTIKRDATPPTLNPTISPYPPTLGGTATATPNAQDALSGVASQSCDPVDTSTAGPKTLTCRATDNAGNLASVPVNYTVGYKVTTVSPTVGPPSTNNVYPTGIGPWYTTAKWKLTNASGSAITAPGTVSAVRYAPMTCGGTAPTYSNSLPMAGGFSSTNPRYGLLQAAWLFNWQLPTTKGCYVLFIINTGDVLTLLYRVN